MSEEKKTRLGVKDYITIASFVFLAGGFWVKVQIMNERIHKLEKINPELIEYKLDRIEKSLADLEDLIKELG